MAKIPANWRSGILEDFLVLQRGFDITKEQAEPGDVPVISSSGTSYYHSIAKVTQPGVITGRKGKLGQVYFVDVPFWPHDTTLWVKDFKGNNPKYIAYFLESIRLERFDAATSVPTLNRNNVHSIKVLFPPLEEQQKISQILGMWDEAIRLTEELIAAKQQRKKALMQQLLTGKRRFPEFTGRRWSEAKFNNILNIEIGRTPSRKQPGYWDKSKLTRNVWLSIADLKGKFVSDSKEYVSDAGLAAARMKLVPAGTVVMSFKLTIGRAAILAVPAYTNEAICSLIPKNGDLIDTRYLYYALAVVSFDREIDQAVKGKTLNKAKIRRLSLKLPPIQEQIRIADVLKACDEEIDLIEQKEYALRQQKKGLMQHLLTGKTRVQLD